MANDQVLERIAAWQAAGLIDAATADRLRAAESGASIPEGAGANARDATRGVALPGVLGSLLDPSPTITEVFAYVGMGFVLAAWHVLVEAWRPTVVLYDAVGSPPVDLVRTILEWAIPAIVLVVAGWLLVDRSDRWRRAAGVLFAAATFHVYGAVSSCMPAGDDFRLNAVLAGASAAASAALLRIRLPALLTQLMLLVALASFATATLSSLEPLVFGEVDYGRPDSIRAGERGLAAAAWWLSWAVAWGLLGRWEAARARLALIDAVRTAARRRADVTRFAAGLLAVLGTTFSLTFMDRYAPGALEPWISDVILLAVSAVMVWLAIRMASPYLYPAALGIIIALSSLNAVYVAEQTSIGVALLAEGVILIGVGVQADRVRRRLTDPQTAPSS
jgi:hypothetical protein